MANRRTLRSRWVIQYQEADRAGYDHLEFTFDNTGILTGWYADIRSGR